MVQALGGLGLRLPFSTDHMFTLQPVVLRGEIWKHLSPPVPAGR